ncbi:hypothetical protein I4I73_10955 [Pseudonocardia sp. KRD-184]|uniref:Uncharacterized protein n=1 Tax=Pseudonocardia oceani TaxID=2792013 RepID=A0ABS6U5H3_9PSEU|nr:hypothetical protein [Pseudonocardia oceani]MBW0089580.1 hypothetical protein [Pseudonocardia oceani]MBW0096506.1 hypothetical protein [Pseudonocardia oceani]MBW0127480.1 hypothetical protein [Pseudonocardia oceani]
MQPIVQDFQPHHASLRAAHIVAPPHTLVSNSARLGRLYVGTVRSRAEAHEHAPEVRSLLAGALPAHHQNGAGAALLHLSKLPRVSRASIGGSR